MKKGTENIEKLCSFYASEWHLTTMLLPYINRELEKNTKIITILEKDIEENIKTLVEKLNLKNEKEVLKINWKSINSERYSDIENLLKKEINNIEENIILVNGCKNYIEINNRNIEKWIEKNKNKKIKIINFFEVTEFSNNIVKILNSHDKILNTSGEREIAEIFEDYIVEEKIENKKAIMD